MHPAWSSRLIQMPKASIHGWARSVSARSSLKSKDNRACCRACRFVSNPRTRKSRLVGSRTELRTLCFVLCSPIDCEGCKIEVKVQSSKIKVQFVMWDLKRQIIWLVVGISFGTFIVYMDARDETGHFEKSVFAFWEIILLAIILTLFYLYSRKKN